MTQAAFEFGETLNTLQVWRLAPACAFNMPTLYGTPHMVGWLGRDHCPFCAHYQGETVARRKAVDKRKTT